MNAWRKTLSDAKYKVFIGWDSREDIAYQVARKSILDTAKYPNEIEVIPLKQDELREKGLYWRDVDKLGSTEFTFTRFLVPELMQFNGWALFIDCDFLFLNDVRKLFDLANDKYAVMCAKHDYTPKEETKMDGQVQHIYPRKNWSSMMLINCGHKSNRKLTKELVNNPDIGGAYLHRFSWLDDKEIGQVSHEWNWLINWYKEPQDGTPRALHYTEGGPWFKEYERCEYAVDWLLMEKKYNKELAKKKNERIKFEKFDHLTPNYNEVLEDLMHYMIDPSGEFYNITIDKIKEKVNKMGEKVVAINTSEINLERKDLVYDPILENFVMGSNGRISTWDRENTTDNALVIRGVGGGSRKAINHCKDTGRTFYFVDTGYFGNGKMKVVHRVTKNDVQQMGPIIERDIDRARMFGYKFKKFTPGRKILLVPPSLKVMELFNQPTPEEWVAKITAQIRRFTNRPIEVRMKPLRSERVTTNTIQSALADDVHCLITYNSIAAVEALMEGKPAIVLGPNAAQVIAETELRNVEDPKIPTRDEMDAFMAHLGYCQFTVPELRSGYAWRTVNESSGLPLWNPNKEQ